MQTLKWGLDNDEIKRRWPKISFTSYGINLGYYNVLQNFPGDCGALILCGANDVSTEELKLAREIASANGFSKIFATIVCIPEYANKQLEKFKAEGWKLVSKGNSNRNKAKRDYVVALRIRNCEYKGY